MGIDIARAYLYAHKEIPYTNDPDTYMQFASDVRQMWDVWNRLEFDGELKPAIVIPSDDTTYIDLDWEQKWHTLGRYAYVELDRDLFGHKAGETVDIIYLCTGALAYDSMCGKGTLYDLAASSLLHEMTHQFCRQRGIGDTDTDGRHNVKFRDAARAHGLICKYNSYGWSDTRIRDWDYSEFYDSLPYEIRHRLFDTDIWYVEESA